MEFISLKTLQTFQPAPPLHWVSSHCLSHLRLTFVYDTRWTVYQAHPLSLWNSPPLKNIGNFSSQSHTLSFVVLCKPESMQCEVLQSDLFKFISFNKFSFQGIILVSPILKHPHIPDSFCKSRTRRHTSKTICSSSVGHLPSAPHIHLFLLDLPDNFPT